MHNQPQPHTRCNQGKMHVTVICGEGQLSDGFWKRVPGRNYGTNFFLI